MSLASNESEIDILSYIAKRTIGGARTTCGAITLLWFIINVINSDKI